MATAAAASTNEETDEATAATFHPLCEEGATRACKIVWTYEEQPGVQHCRAGVETCASGRWSRCVDD